MLCSGCTDYAFGQKLRPQCGQEAPGKGPWWRNRNRPAFRRSVGPGPAEVRQCTQWVNTLCRQILSPGTPEEPHCE